MTLGKKSEMFLRERKLHVFLSDIKKYRFKEKISMQKFQTFESLSDEASPTIPNGDVWQTSELGCKWGSIDTYLWTKFSVDFPAHWRDQKVVGTFNFGCGNTSGIWGSETLLYLDGKPYKGIDQNHLEVVIKPEYLTPNTEFVFRSWSGAGHPNSNNSQTNYPVKIEDLATLGQLHQVSQLTLGVLDEKMNDFYYDVLAILEAVRAMKQTNSTESDALLRAVDKAYKFIDPTLEQYDLDAHREQLYTAHELLKKEKSKLKKNSNVKFSAVAQTHIDVAWLWRIKHTRGKVARSFTTALRLMDEYDDFIFLQSQPQLFSYLKEDYPTIYEEIKQRVVEGRFEVDGAMWLESDCNIPSGESLTRQILYGKQFMKDEFGVNSTFLWMPDVFGYSWALPQILKKSGVKTFCTTKMGWNQYNRIPFNSFWWRGIDGTDILTHLIEDTDFHAISAKTMVEGWEKYKDKELVDGILYHFGFGDGGGGPTEENVELLHRYNEMPGLPEIEFEKAGAYFDRLNETAKETDEYVHTWDGEFYLELHRGTFTSQAFTKKYNRELEFKYRQAEILSTVSHLKTKDWQQYNQEQFNEGWKLLLLNQFHDIIPGSSVAEVYADARIDYEKSDEIVTTQTKNLQASLISEVNQTYSIFNASNWIISDQVIVPNLVDNGEFYCEGKKLASERIDSGYLVQLEKMKPLSFTVITFVKTQDKSTDAPITLTNNVLKTPYYTLTFNEHGHIISLFDEENNREVLAKNQRGNFLQTFDDRPLYWDCWDIDIFYQDRPKDVNELVSMELIENNSLRAVIKFTWKHLSSTIEQELIVYTTSRRIDFKTTADWQDSHRLLRTSFGVDIRSTKATYDIQYGNCERPTHWNTSWDFARFEVVGHKWADLSDSNYGVALLNNCKYGYSIKDNLMGLTLIKAGINPDAKADLGHHEFTYSLYPHAKDWRASNVEVEAYMLNNPLDALEGSATSASLFTFNTDAVAIDAIKKAEHSDDVILRVHEFEGGSHPFVISSEASIESFEEVDLMEQPIGEKVEAAVLETFIKPYEIKTFKVRFK